MTRTPERSRITFVAPLLVALLTCIGSVILPVLFLAVYLAVYYDARLGTWTQTAVLGVILLTVGCWLWGTAGLCLLFICLLPTVAALIFFKRRFSFADGMIYCFATVFLGLALAFLCLYLMYRQDPLSMIISSVESVFRQQEAGSPLFTMAAAQQAMIEWSMDATADLSRLNILALEIAALPLDKFLERVMPVYEMLLRLYAPTAVIIVTALEGVLVWVLPGFALKHRYYRQKPLDKRVAVESFPVSFVHWSLSRPLLLGCMGVMVLSFFTQTTENFVLASGINALQWIARALLIVQGLALSAYWMRSKGISLTLRIVILMLGTALLSSVVMLLGLADASFQFRKMAMLRKHQVKMQALMNQYKDDPRELDAHLKAFVAQVEKDEELSACTETTSRRAAMNPVDPETASDPEDRHDDTTT